MSPELGGFAISQALQVMSPKKSKCRRRSEAEIVEVPDSASDPDMSLDAGGDLIAIERSREAVVSRSDARGDPQRHDSEKRMLEMQADIFHLRNALSEAEGAGHHRIQEVHVHTRQEARAAMAQQYEAFEGVAK